MKRTIINMRQEERAILIWSVFFVISGLVFISAFFFSPVVGVLFTTAYILLYLGICLVFIMVFREIESIKINKLSELKERREELEDLKKAIKKKYYSKKLDEKTFNKIIQDYEKMLTEIDVKIKRLEKGR